MIAPIGSQQFQVFPVWKCFFGVLWCPGNSWDVLGLFLWCAGLRLPSVTYFRPRKSWGLDFRRPDWHPEDCIERTQSVGFRARPCPAMLSFFTAEGVQICYVVQFFWEGCCRCMQGCSCPGWSCHEGLGSHHLILAELLFAGRQRWQALPELSDRHLIHLENVAKYLTVRLC